MQMNPLTALARLPDATPCMLLVGSGEHTLGEVRRALAANLAVEVTTGGAVKRWGRSATYWRRRAQTGEIEGCYQDGGTWRLPVESVQRYLAKLRLPKGSRRRGPWSTPQASRARTPDIQEGPVLARRPSALALVQTGDAEPAPSRLAGSGRKDGAA